ncbi:hypothetical protein CW677_08625 [Macrococcoides caseolyticum]|uniref:phage tail protein n=1 Tax=Macrococcoides caseolyticum TaxID=69966 RepID=UPI000C33889D|nr:hypothetical protein [Macrococcus caseolyticus]PKE47231.1 hypothetical protein CW677_08625 [Macrococcus caseolyticus]
MDMAEFVAKIMADIDDFERDIKKAMAMATNLDDDVVVDIEANINSFRRDLLKAEALAKRFEADDIEKEVELKTNKFMAAWRQIQSANDKFGSDMDELANSIRSFGTVGANVIKGGLLSSFTAIIPIVAALVPAIMAVGNAIAVVGGGAIGAAGAFGILQAGAYAFGFMAASAIKMLNDGMLEASDATGEYEDSLNSLKSAWESVVSENASSIFYAMAAGMRAATSAVQQLTPFLSGVASVVELNARKFHSWVTSSDTAANAFKMLNTVGVQIFNDMLSAVGRFGDGLVNIFTQFSPLFKFMSQGFQNMATSFQEWSQKVSTAEGIQNFIAYVQENLPKIGQIFGNTFEGIFNLFKAFAPNSQTIFDSLVIMSAKFAEWSATIAASDGFQKFIEYVQTNGPTIMGLIGSIVMAIVNFGIAVAPLGQAVLEMVSGFADWVSKMLEAHPMIGQIVAIGLTLLGMFMQLAPVLDFVRIGFGLLSGALGMITAPVWAIIAVIAVLVGMFVYLWQTNEDFRIKVTEIWNQIKEYISMAIQAVVTFVMQIWGTLVSWWNENNDLIMQTATRIWNTILTVIQVAMAIIVPIVQVAWEMIKNVIRIAVDLILGIVKVGMQILNGDWSGAWETIKSTLSNIWNSMMTMISNIIGIILPIISDFVQNAYQWISEKFNAAKDAVVEALGNMLNAIIDWASQTISNVIDAMSNFVSEIVSGGSEALSSLTGALGDMVSAVGDFVGDMVSAGADLIMGMINGIKEKAGDLVKAAVDAVGGAIEAAKSKLGIASPSKVFREIGAFTSEGMAIGITDNARMAVASVTEMAKEMIDAYNPDFASVNASMNKDLGSLNKDLRNTVDADISSGIDVARPVVNVAVHNEGDAEIIRSYVNTEDAIDESLAF